MLGDASGLLDDRSVREMAVARHQVAARPFDLVAQPYRDRYRDIVTATTQPPHAGEAGTLPDHGDRRPREREQIAARQADVLGLQVASSVVGHPARHVTRERGVERGVGRKMQVAQVFGGIEGVRGDKLRIGPDDVIDVLVLQDVRAGRLRDDEVATSTDLGGEHPDVLLGDLAEAIEVPAVQQRRPTASGSAQLTFDAVAFVDPDQGLADLRLLVLDEAGGIDRDRTLPRDEGHGGTGREPGGEPLVREAREPPAGRHPRDGLQATTDERAGLGTHDPVGERGGAGGEPTEPIGAAQHPHGCLGARRLDPRSMLHRIGAPNQPRDVDARLVSSRRVGTVDGATLAVEAGVDHLVLVGRRQTTGIVVGMAVDHLEQRRERPTQTHAALTAMADLEDSAEFGAHVGLVEILGVRGVVDGRHAVWRSGCTVLQHARARHTNARNDAAAMDGPIGARRNIASMPMARTRALPFERSRMVDELAGHPIGGDDPFDVLVVGGGITGAGVALDAAHRGLRVALVERDDFASGTSSKSSKLVHGGLRYLQNGDVRLVYEALHERRRLMRNAPHLVEVLPFLIPIMTKDGVISRKIAKALGSALWMYDLTGGWRIGKLHRRLTAEQAAAHFPTTHLDRLSGGFLYFDATADDARLTLTIARTAAERGAVVVNRCRLVEIVHRDGRVAGAVVDADGTLIEVGVRSIVNACGVWADDIRALDEGEHPDSIRPAKGVHITLPWHLVRNDIAVIIPVRRDKRSLFLVPWGPLGDGTFQHVYVGTTDTDDHGSLDEPLANGDDIEYLLDALNAALDTAVNRTGPDRTSPGRAVTRHDITGIWAGLRPLVNADAGHPGATKDLSRRHQVAVSQAGVVTVTGGKLTTYREMAADAVDALRGILPRGSMTRRSTRRLRLSGAGRASAPGTDARPDAHLARRYGTHADEVRALVAFDASLGEPLVPGLPYLRAEAVYAVRHEMATTLDDVLARRTRAHLIERAASLAAAADVAALIQPELGWSDEETAEQVGHYAAMCAAEEIAGDHVANATH